MSHDALTLADEGKIEILVEDDVTARVMVSSDNYGSAVEVRLTYDEVLALREKLQATSLELVRYRHAKNEARAAVEAIYTKQGLVPPKP